MSRHHGTDLSVGFPPFSLDQEAEEPTHERPLHVRPLDARRLGRNDLEHDRRAHADDLVRRISKDRIAEIGLEVVEPAAAEIIGNTRVLAGDAEIGLTVEELHLRVGEHGPVVGPLRQDQRPHVPLVHGL